MAVAAVGFAVGFSLILAIGAQNAFVLKQGLKRQHVFLICAICAMSDALLILCGVAGFAQVVKNFPLIETVTRYAGALFLFVYGMFSWRNAFTASGALAPAEEGAAAPSAARAAALCLAFTWLNPHVYLDTMFLVGALSVQYGALAWQFGLGAAAASFVFFFALGYGARLLTPLFKKPVTWRILEGFIGLVMFAIALSLVV